MAADKVSGKRTVQNTILRLGRILIKLLVRVKVSHLERVPPQGPLIVIINHISIFDPVVAIGALPRLTIPMGKQEAFNWFILGRIFKLYGVIPVRRGEADLPAVKSALRILRAGGVVLLAPEGTRSPTGQLQPGKDGAVLMALRSGAAILPVGVTGTEAIKAAWLRVRRPTVHLAVGEPFRLCSERLDRKGPRREIAAMTAEMMARLARQLPETYRGVYRPAEETAERYLAPVGD
jgi:1-acyl-sn-glycerol-3-phosphate acyltransferase